MRLRTTLMFTRSMGMPGEKNILADFMLAIFSIAWQDSAMSLTPEDRKKVKEWAATIRKKRKRLGLTQEQLAKKSDKYGLSYLQKIENGVCCTPHAFEYFLSLLTERRSA